MVKLLQVRLKGFVGVPAFRPSVCGEISDLLGKDVEGRGSQFPRRTPSLAKVRSTTSPPVSR